MADARPVRGTLAVPSEVTTEYAGTRLGAYYTDAATMYATQVYARDAFRDRYGIDVGAPGRVDVPAYVGSAALGAWLVLPEDNLPMIAGVALPRAEDVDALALPGDYFDAPWPAFYDRMRGDMARVAGLDAPARMGAGLEGPITTAKLLRGEAFFTDLHDDPPRAHRLLDLVTESYIRFMREARERNGDSMAGVGICDDFAGLISPAMWPEFVVPCYRRIYDAFDPDRRGSIGARVHHSELLRPGHMQFLEEVGVTLYDAGVNQYMTIRETRELIDIPISWQVYTVRDLLQGTPESIRAAYRDAVDGGAYQVVGEICRKTPPENIRAFLDAAREFGEG